MFPANKSHIASMNLRTTSDPPEAPRQEEKSRSTHKYKKSLILQEATLHLVKRTSDYSRREEAATERFSKERPHKQSADYGPAQRIRTDMDEGRYSRQEATVEISVEEVREVVTKLRALREEKEALQRELRVFKK
jgi:monomeric isocitrate dehydrogenase